MNCKECNTRLSSGQKACPQCGRAVNVRAGVARKAVAADKRPLSASRDEGIELELRDETIPPRPAKSKAVGKPKAARARGEGHVAVRTPIALQPSDMRSLLADQPDLLEEDLCIYTDEKGKTDGLRPQSDLKMMSHAVRFSTSENSSSTASGSSSTLNGIGMAMSILPLKRAPSSMTTRVQ